MAIVMTENIRTVILMRLIDADSIRYTSKGCGHPYCQQVCENIDGNGTLCKHLMTDKSEIDSLPTVDAVPVVHGHWTRIINPRDGYDCFQCSSCKRVDLELMEYDYCPRCGAKMDETTVNRMIKHEVINYCPLCGKKIEVGTASTITVWGIGKRGRDIYICEDCEREFEMIYADDEGGDSDG